MAKVMVLQNDLFMPRVEHLKRLFPQRLVLHRSLPAPHSLNIVFVLEVGQIAGSHLVLV